MNSTRRAHRLPRTRREPLAILAAPSGAERPRNPRLRHGRVLRSARHTRASSRPSPSLTTPRARRR